MPGLFKKGQSGNPGGRPKVVAEVKELAREYTSEAIETLVSIMTNPKSAPASRVSAANSLLDRGYGKPPQHQHITGADGPQYVVRLPEPCKTAVQARVALGYGASVTAATDKLPPRHPTTPKMRRAVHQKGKRQRGVPALPSRVRSGLGR